MCGSGLPIGSLRAKAVRLEIKPGVGGADSRGVPLGCCGYGNPLEVCTAQLSSERCCSLCERVGGFPLPAWWRGACENENLACPSVQVVPTALPSLPWAVIAFLELRYVNPRWPIIGARNAAEAVRLALARGLQAGNASRLEVIQPGQWRARRSMVLAGAAFARFEREGGNVS